MSRPAGPPGGAAGPTAVNSPATILVVDDSPTKRYVISSWLRRAGYLITEAATGADALRMVHEPPVDLVVLDVRLPDADGFEVCEQIKSDPRTSALPVIHVSAHAVNTADVTQGLNRGADAYLPEPIDPDELVATVHAVLRYYTARRRAERLARRLSLLVETTTSINAASTLPTLLQAAADGAAAIFEQPASVSATPEEGGPITAEARPDHPAFIRPSLANRLPDELEGGVGARLWLDEAAPWSHGPIWRVVARVKDHRAPIHLGVDATGFQDDDGPLLRQLGQAVALAVEAMRSIDEERRIALTLQRSLLPRRLPTVAGLELAVRYSPASEVAEVGGDFYEAVYFDRQLIAAIGDVGGHSLHAATVMAELRHGLRAFIAEGHGPGAIVDRLNNLVLRFLPDEIATMCVLRIDPATGSATLANAGHPSPLLIREGEVSLLEKRVALLGVPIPHSAEASVQLLPGDTLLFVTDGLIERRGHSFDEGVAALCKVAAQVDATMEAYADRLLAELEGLSRDDDVALLALRFSG
jgi:CheY-like chemotaxis protein